MFISEIAGVSVQELAQQFSTPLYVYDQSMIQQRIKDLQAFPTIRYAQKANSNLAILSLMKQHGVKVDAVSAGEIHRALLAGYDPWDICYTSDIFDQQSLYMVENKDIPVNCGSPDMIWQLGERCPGRNITLRINPGFGHGHSQKTNTGGQQSKHGIWHEQLPECLELARNHDLYVTGIHMHIGSGTDLEHLAQVCGALKNAAQLVGPDLETISGGGGLPTPYRPNDQPLDVKAYIDVWMKTRRDLEKLFGKSLNLEVEPGRYLVAESGHLICEIRAVKQMGDNIFYLLDAGFNVLARPVLYGAYHGMSICHRGEKIEETQPVIVGGPLCESGDIFTQAEGGFVESRELPRANVGDLLVIHGTGAYSFTMASNYNSMPLPAEVLLVDQSPELIRARQSLDDLVRGERMP